MVSRLSKLRRCGFQEETRVSRDTFFFRFILAEIENHVTEQPTTMSKSVSTYSVALRSRQWDIYLALQLQPLTVFFPGCLQGHSEKFV